MDCEFITRLLYRRLLTDTIIAYFSAIFSILWHMRLIVTRHDDDNDILKNAILIDDPRYSCRFTGLFIYYKILHEVHDRPTYRKNNKIVKESTRPKHKHWI